MVKTFTIPHSNVLVCVCVCECVCKRERERERREKERERGRVDSYGNSKSPDFYSMIHE